MLLRNDDPWMDSLPIPDIRNWRVLDETGNDIGSVETLVIDRQNSAFEALLIGPNDRFAADEVEVGEGVIRITRPLHRRQETESTMNGVPSDFENAYQRHFEKTFDTAEWSFDDVLPAYRFGRELASDADFAGRSFESAEEDIRAYYVSKRLPRAFHDIRPAILCGYTLVHRSRPYEGGGLNRDAKQILAGKSGQNAKKAGAAMSNMRPGDDHPAVEP